jgi:hypothetical protein
MTPKPHTWYILYEEMHEDTFQKTLLYVINKEGRKWKHYVVFLDSQIIRTDYDNEKFFVDKNEYEEGKKETPEELHLHYVEKITTKEAWREINFFPKLKTKLFKHIFNG